MGLRNAQREMRLYSLCRVELRSETIIKLDQPAFRFPIASESLNPAEGQVRKDTSSLQSTGGKSQLMSLSEASI